MTSHFIRPLDFAQPRDDKPFKTTLHLSKRLLVGLNTLRPGQAQPLHDHIHQDKFYQVLDGEGVFTVGDETETCGPGELILAPAGIVHGVENRSDDLLSFLTVMAPAPN